MEPEQTQENREDQPIVHNTELEHEIFGNSDDDEDLADLNDINEDLYASDDEEDEQSHPQAPADQYYREESPPPLPSFKKKKKTAATTSKSSDDQEGETSLGGRKNKPIRKKISRKHRRGEEEEEGTAPVKRDLSPESLRRVEAEEFFEKTLAKTKPKRANRDLGDETVMDEFMSKLLQDMKRAADEDQSLNERKLPALAKLKMLPKVLQELSKASLHVQFLENNILEGVKLWLEPLQDGSLPPLDIQETLIKLLVDMPVDAQHLRESLLGRVIKFYTLCDRVPNDVKNKADLLIRKWIRPILKRSANYRDRKLSSRQYTEEDAPRVSVKASDSTSRGTRRPIPVAPGYSVVPVSSLDFDPSDKPRDQFRKMKSTMLKMKSSASSSAAGSGSKTSKLSIEGRGV